MNHRDSSDLSILAMAAVLRRIGNRAVRNAQDESRRLGVPNVFSRNGRLYFELPSGEITVRNPFGPPPGDE